MESGIKVFAVGDCAYVRGFTKDGAYCFKERKIIGVRKKTIYGSRQNAYTLEGCRCEYAARDLLNNDEVLAERLKGLEVKNLSE